jgi:hypothetical protein
MSVDHVTYMMREPELRAGDMQAFFNLIGMREVKPSAHIEQDWTVRWFEDDSGFQVHIVAGPRTPELELSHFCVIISQEMFQAAVLSPWLERQRIGSPRIWLKGPGGLRVEVHASRIRS